MDLGRRNRRRHCFVINCNNNSIKSPEKNFFTVPCGNKAAWCEAVGLDYVPATTLFICEDHLNVEEDLENYMYWKTMINVKARLKPQVPLLKGIFQEFCIVCLSRDAKLYDMESCNLIAEYEAITSFSLPEDAGVPQMLCWECRARLISCVRFREKAILTQTILSEITPCSKRNIKLLANIDRDKYNLISPLVTKNFGENDIECIEAISQDTEPLIKVKQERCSDSDDGVSDEQTYTLMEHELDIHIKLDTDSLEMADPDDAQDFRETNKVLSTLQSEKRMETKIDPPVSNEANTSNKFICHHCSECFEAKSDLERHIYTHESIGMPKERKKIYTKKNHECFHCKFKTVNRSLLKLHVNSVHASLNVLRCKICSYTCNKKYHLMRHLKKHTVTPEHYKCDRCELIQTS